MNKEIKVVIIDDHPTMALGISHILGNEAGISVLGIASTGIEGIELVQNTHPTVVILDLNLPDLNGVRIAAAIKEKHPAIHVIIHTGFDYTPYFNQLVESGVSGILNKSAAPEDILEMIRAAVRGYTILPLPVFRQIQLQRPEHAKHYWEADLTPTEQKILSMVADKQTNSRIAGVIHMSESSVENYLKRIYSKLGVRSKSEAIAKIENDDRFQKVDEDAE
ncbi:response regulator transcription factor [Paenibacillus sp. N4]|uniref:response regulator n=1 Tax=Paenibacillus vietnamensis TaxID=2590547 RepID=UPI001CD189AC|nr:response regulator transcription factor [Paenibacillus vietnamensis]MCA0756142.1 response regulator transcription factor [Paenibacillus vietnamensis]